MMRLFHDSLFAGHLGISRTVYRQQDRVYWPGLWQDVRSYIASCMVCLARKSPCPRRAPMGRRSPMESGGYESFGHVSYNPKGNRYVLVMVDCFSRWTEACPLPDKTALAVV